MAWSGEHRKFFVDEFIKNDGLPILTHHFFRNHFANNPLTLF